MGALARRQARPGGFFRAQPDFARRAAPAGRLSPRKVLRGAAALRGDVLRAAWARSDFLVRPSRVARVDTPFIGFSAAVRAPALAGATTGRVARARFGGVATAGPSARRPAR